MTLRDVLDEAAAGLSGIETADAPDGSLAWSRVGQPFAALSADGTVAEFALDAAVAAAAARTSDAALSGRGPGWVQFSPPVLDDHVVDRAAAWFASAHRRASRA